MSTLFQQETQGGNVSVINIIFPPLEIVTFFER